MEAVNEADEDFQLSKTSSTINIKWKKPKFGSRIDGYNVKYREVREDKQKFIIEQTDDTEIELRNLKSDTKYEIMVYCTIDEDDNKMFKTTISTDVSWAPRLIEMSEKESDSPCIYRLTPIRTTKPGTDVTCCEMISEYTASDENLGEEKTVMFLGATGSGKTTMIDAMFNYILGVSFGSEYRFKITQLTDAERAKKDTQTESQTDAITCYRIPKQSWFPFDFGLNIIDTPGFNDVRGIKFDERIPDMVKNLFEKCLESLDAICVVIPMSCQRLTATEKYVFNNILSVFGKDIEENIFPLLTFDDGGKSDALEALKEGNVPFRDNRCFRFNNANLFQCPAKDSKNILTESWDKRCENFKKFFNSLANIKKKSLIKSKEVLQTRSLLQNQLERMQEEIIQQFQIVNNVKNEKEILVSHQAEIENNKDFEYTTFVPEKELRSRSYLALNCHICKKTCCEQYGWIAAFKSFVFDRCQCGCRIQGHRKECSTFETVYKEKTMTKEDMLKKYQVAEDETNKHEALLEQQKVLLKRSIKEIYIMLEDARQAIDKLQEIALKPKKFGVPEYIDKLINTETQELKQGYRARVDLLLKSKEMFSRKQTLTEMVHTLFEHLNLN